MSKTVKRKNLNASRDELLIHIYNQSGTHEL